VATLELQLNDPREVHFLWERNPTPQSRRLGGDIDRNTDDIMTFIRVIDVKTAKLNVVDRFKRIRRSLQD